MTNLTAALGAAAVLVALAGALATVERRRRGGSTRAMLGWLVVAAVPFGAGLALWWVATASTGVAPGMAAVAAGVVVVASVGTTVSVLSTPPRPPPPPPPPPPAAPLRPSC